MFLSIWKAYINIYVILLYKFYLLITANKCIQIIDHNLLNS
jgi:hypothetical protein